MLKLQAACHMHGPANGALKREAAYTAALASCVQATGALQSGQTFGAAQTINTCAGLVLEACP